MSMAGQAEEEDWGEGRKWELIVLLDAEDSDDWIEFWEAG